jgi:hypothetical protein
MKAALIQMASYDEEEVRMLDFDRDHLMYARRLHFMFRNRRPECCGIISTPTDDLLRAP